MIPLRPLSQPLAAAISIFDQFPGLWQLLLIAGAAVLIWIMIRYAKGGTTLPNGFVIRVDGNDIHFSGQFPPPMEALVTDFLRDDVAIDAPYEIRGHWEDRLLVVIVKGDAARPMEQRIRNFLKLNIKRPQ